MQAIIDTVASWFSAILSFFKRIFEWFVGIFGDLMEFLSDLPIKVLGGILDGVIYVLSALPVPSFLTDYSLQGLFSGLPDSVLYFVDFFGIAHALAIIGSGVMFRLLRKAVTLGQW